MEVLALLIPASLILGGVGLAAFVWALRRGQFEDLEGDSHRVLSDRFDDAPADVADRRTVVEPGGRSDDGDGGEGGGPE